MLPRVWMEAYINFLLRFRVAILIAVAIVTLFLTWHARNMQVYTNFFDLYPPGHPYIKLYNEYRKMFGTANVLMIMIERKDGDIFNVDTINKINKATIQVMETPGVNPYQVRSLTHPKMKNIRITGAMITAYPIMYPAAPKTPEDVKPMKKAVYTNEGVHGFFVSRDNTAALISAGFWEEGVDFRNLYNRLTALEQEIEADGKHTVYISGFPMLYSWIFSYKNYILGVIGATMVIILVMLWFYFRTFTGVWVPLFSGLLSAVLAMGLAGYYGFNLDPLVLVVLVLITARALSHSVQSMERYHEEYHRLEREQGDKANKMDAIMASYLSLFSPAIVSILADGFAILTLALAHIPLIQKLAYVSSFWVFTIFISVVTLHPIILYYIPPPPHDPKSGKRFSDKMYNSVNRMMVRISQGNARYAVLGSFSVALVVGMVYAQNLKIGDVSIGKALMYDDHPYNVAYDRINQKFVGASQLVILAEGKEAGVIKDPQVLQTLEKFQRHMEQQELVGGSITVTTMARRLYQMFQEGIPKWGIIPDNPRDVGNIFYQFLNTIGADDLDSFLDKNSQNATITVYYKDYNHETVVGSIENAQKFIDENPIENVTFRLAGGLLGILAAVNEEVEWSYKWNLILVMVTVFVLSMLTYASVVGALIVMIPSIVAQPLSEAMMYWMGIDANINSLPVAAVGIGIGIDYGYYVLSRIVEEFQRFGDHDRAIEEALMTTGRAIMFTGTTLTVSVVFWVFFPMKFQSEMAILLTLLLFFHVVGALAFIPGIVSLLKPRFPLPNKIMLVLLFAIFVPAGALYYFDHADLLWLGILATIVGVCEHVYATRHNIGMELRG
ncbi:MAG: MMPL family transporter [Deltaproteobacteria bacterium]|nr:MMPL family transporter [Deltaproteobacteria bacterium]